jgi:hypothetical protein
MTSGAPDSDDLAKKLRQDSLRYKELFAEAFGCGAVAANRLDAFIARRPVRCAPKDVDQHWRTVASCAVGDTNLGEWCCRSRSAASHGSRSTPPWRGEGFGGSLKPGNERRGTEALANMHMGQLMNGWQRGVQGDFKRNSVESGSFHSGDDHVIAEKSYPN